MEKYQGNAIKAIYAPQYDNDKSITTKSLENYYKFEHSVNENAIEIPDVLTSKNGYHSFSKNANTTNSSFTDTARVDKTVYDDYVSYYKILNEKDIYWDNAYLRYTQCQNVDYDKPIKYLTIDPNTGKFTVENTEDAYVFDRNIINNSSKIKHTYELLNIIDYLLSRMQALYFELSIVKQQKEQLDEYRANNT